MALDRRGGKWKNRFKILLGLARFAARQKCEAHLPIGDTKVYRVINTMRDLLEPLRRDPRPGVFPAKAGNGYQGRQSPRLRIEIIQRIGGFESLAQERFCLFWGTHSD